MAEQIDRDHEILHEILTQLRAGVEAGAGWSQLRVVLLELASYTDAHFENEEDLMVSTQYPDLPAHKAEHDEFRRRVAEIKNAVAAGNGPNPREVLDVLSGWLEHHVEGTDRPLAEHIDRRLGIFSE